MNVQQKYIKDIYHQFIESIQNKCYSKNEKLYKHRIIPGFEGGTYSFNNVLLCNYKDHCLAHYYRWLAYKKFGDPLAWRLMICQDEHIFLLRCHLLGKARGDQQKKEKSHFFSKSWQAKYGDRNAGKKNISIGHIQKLNESMTKTNPNLRSKAGKIGGISNQKIQRQNKTHFYNPTAPVQKLGNFVGE